MFNLLRDTKHEAGIIVFETGNVGVFNWASCDDNCIPMLSPIGTPISWSVENEDASIVHLAHTDDVREYLPGTVRNTEEDGLETDMDVIYDANDDIPALWGFGEAAAYYKDGEHPYSGDIWELSEGGHRIITIDFWN